MMDKSISFISQLYHFLVYSIKEPEMQLDKAMLIISIDIDVGTRELGVINKGRNDANVNDRISEYRIGEIEEAAFPFFAEAFSSVDIPVTFAVRGQLTEVNSSLLDSLLKSPVKHDIGAHGYYHRAFTSLSFSEAEKELNKISVGMKKFGIVPKSFVFPRNRVAHLELLEKYGYECYRNYGNFMCDSIYIEKRGQLFDIHPSLYLDGNCSTFPKRILDIAIVKRLPIHVWFHLWSFGETIELIEKNLNNVLLPLLKYAKEKERKGEMTLETMRSAGEKSKI